MDWYYISQGRGVTDDVYVTVYITYTAGFMQLFNSVKICSIVVMGK